jgi:hypothetical protein
MKRTVLIAALLLCGCDQYANNTTGNTRINEITAYGNIRCVLVVSSASNTISCDWDHPGSTQQVPR